MTRAFAPCAALLAFAALGSACFDSRVQEVFYESQSAASRPITGHRPPEPRGLAEVCIPLDEDFPEFPGFSREEVNLATGDAQCRSLVCLSDHFQGRVSCPEGNQDGGVCLTPLGEEVAAEVPPQLPERPAEDAVFCSCRCDGPGSGPFCDCPRGMFCEERIPERGLGDDEQYAGSYCVKRP